MSELSLTVAGVQARLTAAVGTLINVLPHAVDKMNKLGISADKVANAITRGRRYYDTKHDNIAYWCNRVYVAIDGNTVVTVFKSARPRGSRWDPLP